MKKKLAGTRKKIIGYWPVQINGNKFATGQILKKPVEVVKGRILAGWVPKSPEPCPAPSGRQQENPPCRAPPGRRQCPNSVWELGTRIGLTGVCPGL